MFTSDELKECLDAPGLQLQRASFGDFLDELNQMNHLLKKGVGVWQLQPSGLSLSQRNRDPPQRSTPSQRSNGSIGVGSQFSRSYL